MAPKISLDSVPIIDNHCHAGMIRNPRQQQELYARSLVEAGIPPQTWRDYVDAVRRSDGARLEEIDCRHGVRRRLDKALEMNASTLFTRALQIGCSELYGEWEDQERLARLSAEARRDGMAPLYQRALDRVNCPVVLTDSPRVDRAVWPESRFKWVARLDPFLYPFGPGELTTRGTEVATFHARFQIKLNLALGEQSLEACPSDLADYLAFVDRVLDSFIARGVVALKVVSAYVRSLEFRPTAEGDARRVYRDLSRGKKEESRLFEDFMARRMLLWAAERGLPVQVHAGLGHPEPGMDFVGNNPLMLQSILMDERYSSLKLVLLHGAYPFCGEAGALAYTYGSVYLDFSRFCFLNYHFFVDRLSEWLELLPAHKLLWGTDIGVPEVHLGATRLGRRAIEAALNRGVEANIWSESQARGLGDRVCYRNVCELYNFSL